MEQISLDDLKGKKFLGKAIVVKLSRAMYIDAYKKNQTEAFVGVFLGREKFQNSEYVLMKNVRELAFVCRWTQPHFYRQNEMKDETTARFILGFPVDLIDADVRVFDSVKKGVQFVIDKKWYTF